MFAIHGAYYDNNFGDLLLLRIFENWVREATSSPIVYPLVPKKEQQRFGRFFPDTQFGTGQHRLWQGLVYAGGGHFGEPSQQSKRGYKGYRNWSVRFFLRHVLPAELCLRDRTPYLIAGVGVGPISNPLVRQEVRRIFSRAEMISVRNEDSKAFVQKELGIERVKVVPDAALTLTRDHIPAFSLEAVEKRLAPYGDRPLLGIHHPRYLLADTPQATVVRESLCAVLSEFPDVVPVVFVDDGGGAHSEPCDRLAQQIRSATGGPCVAIPFQGPWQTVALISRLSAVITTKLHVAIVAYALGIYAESCAVHPKVVRFFEQIGRSPQCTLLHDLDQAIALQKVSRVVQMACSPPSIQDDTWAQVRQQALVNRDIVADFVQMAIA